jgi:3-hydroxyacyl-CoA dehydrogenase
MGAGIAQVAAQAGHRVLLADAQTGAVERAVAAMSKDRLNDELLLIVLSYSQRIGADGIIDERVTKLLL